MNECDYAVDLGAYHDGELSPAWRAEVAEHLRQCPQCAAELERLEALSQILHAEVREPALPLAMMGRLHKMADGMGSGRLLHLAESLAAVAAAILLVCSVALAVVPSNTAVPALPQWQLTAVAPSAENASADSEEQFAAWAAQDLSTKGSNE